jgi:uncharacterized protein (DUF1778 family)
MSEQDTPSLVTDNLRATHAERIDIRLSQENKELIERAASIEDISVSAFVVGNALCGAKQVVADHDKWLLNRKDSTAFVGALLNPPEPNEALSAAAERYKGDLS